VLVVDDALTTRTAIKALLELAGYDVLTATNGEEALLVLHANPCQLVVSDIQMPRLDGLELTRRIRANPRLQDTKVLLVTALSAQEEKRAGLDAGADGYLVKHDVEKGVLIELARQLVSSGRAAEDAT
ncbi:MAG: response regulator, partial [Myxococcaceae bacterium]